MLKIKTLRYYRMSKAVKGEFHKEILDHLMETGLSQSLQGVPFEEYREEVEHYFTLFSQHAASPLTAELVRYDEARDALFSSLRGDLEAMEKSVESDVADYYEQTVKYLVNAYKGVYGNEDYMTETTHITNYCRRVLAMDDAILSKAFVSKAKAQYLYDLNEKFISIFSDRIDERTQIEDAAALANSFHEKWLLISNAITVLANTPISDANREVVETAQAFVGWVNEHITYYKYYYVDKKGRRPEGESPNGESSISSKL